MTGLWALGLQQLSTTGSKGFKNKADKNAEVFHGFHKAWNLISATAMLTLLVRSNQHKFHLSDYRNGDLPSQEEVAVAQTLANLS